MEGGGEMRFSTSELISLKQRSYLHGVGLFMLDGTGYALAIAGTIAAPHLRQRILCSIIAGFWISGLVTIAHDACHQSLTPSRRLNRFLGTLAFLPAWHAYSLWQYGHNHLHHLFTNLRGRDYVWEPLSLAEFRILPWWSRVRYRFFRTFVGHFFYYSCEIWWKRRFFPRRQYLGRMDRWFWIDFLIVVGWLVMLSAIVVNLRARVTMATIQTPVEWISPILLAVILPFVVSTMLSSTSEFLHHTHPRIHWFTQPASGDWTNRQVQTTVHCQFPAPIDRLMHWIMDHTAHHIQPTIPSYHLLEAQRIVESQRSDEVVTYRWTLPAMLTILRACKLYDCDAGCWTDYKGTPTSASRFAAAADAGSGDFLAKAG